MYFLGASKETNSKFSDKGEWYAVTYLLPQQYAIMETEYLFTETKTFTYSAYEVKLLSTDQ